MLNTLLLTMQDEKAAFAQQRGPRPCESDSWVRLLHFLGTGSVTRRIIYLLTSPECHTDKVEATHIQAEHRLLTVLKWPMEVLSLLLGNRLLRLPVRPQPNHSILLAT